MNHVLIISRQVNGSQTSRAGWFAVALVAGQSGSVSPMRGVNDRLTRTLEIGSVVLIAFTLPLLIVVVLAINYEKGCAIHPAAMRRFRWASFRTLKLG
jgi:hypothetical protein